MTAPGMPPAWRADRRIVTGRARDDDEWKSLDSMHLRLTDLARPHRSESSSVA